MRCYENGGSNSRHLFLTLMRIVLFVGIDGQLVRLSSRFNGTTRAAPTSTPKRGHATPAPPFYDSSKVPKTTVLLVTAKAAHALNFPVQVGFPGPYVSFEPTQPPYEHQQARLVVYEKEQPALLAHNLKYGDAAFAPLHRNLLALKKFSFKAWRSPAENNTITAHTARFLEGRPLSRFRFVLYKNLRC